ncbi:aminoglycoside phosphotransferase family protein [Amnibacterium sp. CER49]|uniref:aminoglycoside phosphotransferase family protein n=1 Tax=Amnibacterium sp. CER49 TaxID=3039161 RepID=UPI00244CA764|nr:aminoglycoside phosphotransferase family protein [Amnibacterium sp. CER49]MDH2443031.1 aminoglycoside phosphotransferase family protein [Amnibacterium sp. CER49]
MSAPTSPVVSLQQWQRLDFRFLLPGAVATPIALGGRPAGDLAEAIGALGAVTALADTPDGSAGLVVLADPDDDDLRHAVVACRPGGWVYAEVRPRRSAGRGRRSLAAWRRAFVTAGLESVRVHWHLRDLASATRIVSLDSRAALRRVLGAHEGSRAGHLRALAGRTALDLRLLDRVAPEGSVLARRPDGGAARGTATVLEQLAAQALPADRGFESLLLTPREPTSRYVIAFVHERGDARPAAVLKSPRRAGDEASLDDEAAVLRRVADALGPAGPRIPAVLGVVRSEAGCALAQSMVTGKPLSPAVVRRDFAAALELGRSFIAALPVTVGAADNDGWYEAAVAEPLERLAGVAGLDGQIGELAARTHAALQPLRSRRLPAVLEHADLAYPNLLLGQRPDEPLGIIDWERSSQRGVPGHDLVFYAQFLAEARTGADDDDPDSITRAFDTAWTGGQGWAVPVLRGHLADRGVDQELWGALVLTAWTRTAATLAVRLVPQHGDPTEPAADVAASVAASRELALWRHALLLLEQGRLGGVVS